MKDIIKMLRELKLELFKIVFLESFLDAMVVFFLTYLALTLVNFYPMIAVAPALVCFVIFLRVKSERISLRKVEDTNPSVREMLRTAADNVNDENYIVKLLNQEVIQKMRDVATSKFFRFNRTLNKILIIVCIAAITIGFASRNVHLLDIQGALSSKIGEGDLPIVSTGDANIFSDVSDIANLGNEKVDITFNPSSYELNLENSKEAEKETFESHYPTEVIASPEQAYLGEVPKEQQELVKRYFESIKTKR